MERPVNQFGDATAVIAAVSMIEEPFLTIEDDETKRVLTTLEGCTFNVVRSANELFWCREKAWKTYRLTSQDISNKAGLRPSDQIEIYWWAFVNYVYQFEEKIKLYLNNYNTFAPFFALSSIQNPGTIVRAASKRLRRFTGFRHESIHGWHNPPEVVSQLPLIEFMQENKELFRHLPGAGYLNLPNKVLFRMTRRGMQSEMQVAMTEMAAISDEVVGEHKSGILLACYKVTSYTQWAKAGQAKFRFGS